ncbi:MULTISPECIES: ceramidase domain-containing protein [Alphaproteobacteria]|uniref:Membrane protein n=2 Tax=Alphaproteobacteria TaxID=28211 RepID=A0A512HD50_9HYPH|nr:MULTISPECIES: ceramidase domain-containing protein [Alphaproteobacteria]GEO83300.1 membrane protein [Ciceribacter naphthalenivorans]GLR20305.1 membrane protein [Ciceribacter naphthalenivorans]GLT03161.1 membrane protein [Sphingomonas psychrolutea]
MTIDWNTPITGTYCERAAPGFWGEPLNATSSLLVVVVSIIGMVHIVRTRNVTPGIMAFMALAVAIGTGSFLWHTFATRWAELTDVLPIWSFVALYGAAVIKDSLRPTISVPVSIATGFLVFGAGIALSMRETHMLGDTVSGSTQYLPALFVVFATGRLVWKERHPSLRLMGIAVGLFALSFLFRSLDLPLCDLMPTGTHFLWHVTNCLAFGVLLVALMRFPQTRRNSTTLGPSGARQRFPRLMRRITKI